MNILKYPALPRLVIAFALIAIFIRSILFLVLVEQNDITYFYLPDSYMYELIGENVLSGHGFSIRTSPPYLPDSERTPVLPLVLGTFNKIFHTPIPFVAVEILLSGFIVIISYLIAREITQNERISLLTALFMAIEPFTVYISMTLLTEILFVTFMFTGAYASFLYLRTQQLSAIVLASLCFGLSALTRPVGEFLPLVLIPFILPLFPRVRFWKALAAVLIPFILVISPWLVRNHHEFGVIAFSSGGLQNLYSEFGGDIVSLRDHISWDEARDRLVTDYMRRHNESPETLKENLRLAPSLFGEGIGIIVANPYYAAKTVGMLSIPFFTSDLWTYYLQKWNLIHHYQFGFSPTKSLMTEGPIVTLQKVIETTGGTIIIPFAGRVVWVLITLLFFVGSVIMLLRSTQRRAALMALLFVLYFWGTSLTIGEGVTGRYRFPVYPIMFAIACVGAQYLYARMTRRPSLPDTLNNNSNTV